MHFMHFELILAHFGWVWGCKMCVFHWQGRQNMHSRQKWALAVLGLILNPFWVLMGCLGKPKMRKSRFQERLKKTSIFEIPFFPTLADFRCSGAVKSSVPFVPASLLFWSWRLFFLLGNHCLQFWWILVFWDLFVDEFSWFLDIVLLRTRLHFLRQYSAMNRRGSGRNRQDSDHFLHIQKHVSGVRRSSL